MELDFFTGYHGSGKSYTANQIKNDMGAEIVDCGPVIREAFAKSGVDDFGEWTRQQEIESGVRWDDIILLDTIKDTLAKTVEARKRLFVVGNRNIETIDFIKEGVSDGEDDKILFFEKPFLVMKQGYETRTGKTLTDAEFMDILMGDEKMGLAQVKAHVEAHPETDTIIRSERHDKESIELARNALLKTIKRKKGEE